MFRRGDGVNAGGHATGSRAARRRGAGTLESREELLEDSYLRLKHEHEQLKKRYNGVVENLKIAETKLARIRSKAVENAGGAQHVGSMGGGAGMARGGGKRNRELEDLVDDLRKRNAALKRKNGDLDTTVKKLRQQLQRKFGGRRGSGSRGRGRGRASIERVPPEQDNDASSTASGDRRHLDALRSENYQLRQELERLEHAHQTLQARDAGASLQGVNLENIESRERQRLLEEMLRVFAASAPSEKVQKLVEALTNRLRATERHFQLLNAENKDLKQALSQAQRHVQASATVNADIGESAMREHTRLAEDLKMLQRELRDKDAKLELLVRRYEHLEVTASDERQIQSQTINQLDEARQKIREMRRSIQELQMDKRELEARSGRVAELESEVMSLRKELSDLEDRNVELCENPFVNDAAERRDRKEKIRDLQRHVQQQDVQIQYLKDTIKSKEDAIQVLMQKFEDTATERDDLRTEVGQLRNDVRHAKQENAVLTDQVALYSGGASGIEHRDLYEALALVKRRRNARGPGGGVGEEDNIDDIDMITRPASKRLDTVVELQREVEKLQVERLALVQENQRAERMLELQTNINKDLEEELKERREHRQEQLDTMAKKLKEALAVSEERRIRLQQKDAEIRDLQYSRRGRHSKNDAGGRDRAMGLLEENADNLPPLVVDDLGPGENVLEIWVKKARFDPALVDGRVSTFVLIDFFDFESQPTKLHSGLLPNYNLATTFKVNVDDFFFAFMTRESAIFEVNASRYNDYELIGRCSVGLLALLGNKGVLRAECPICRPSDGIVIGSLSLQLRMAVPIAAAFEGWLSRHEGERKRIVQARKLLQEREEEQRNLAKGQSGRDARINAHDNAARGDIIPATAPRPRNYLQVQVCTADRVLAHAASAPSLYVQYHIPGFNEDVLTPVQLPSSNPEFHHTRSFPLSVDTEGLGWMARQRVTFHVFDDSLDANDGDASIGSVEVPLKPLADGHSIEGFFKIKPRKGKGKDLGRLELAISWRNDLLASKYGGAGPSQKSVALHGATGNSPQATKVESDGPRGTDQSDDGGSTRSEGLSRVDRNDMLASFGLPRNIPNGGATRVEWAAFLPYVLRSRDLAEAQVEWRLLVVEALGGDVDAAEERGLGGHKLREALETEDRDGDGFVTIDEVRNCLAKALPRGQMLGDQHIDAIVKNCNRGEVAQICMALRLHEPKWLAPVRRAIEDSGHDASSLGDRFRAAQEGGQQSGVTDVSRDAFVRVLDECGVSFRE